MKVRFDFDLKEVAKYWGSSSANNGDNECMRFLTFMDKVSKNPDAIVYADCGVKLTEIL